MNEKIEQLAELARPLAEWLRNNYDPHVRVVVDCDGATLLREELGAPYHPA